MAMYPIFSSEPVWLRKDWPRARFLPSDKQVWTEFEEMHGIIVIEDGQPPVHHRIEQGIYRATEVTLQ